MTDSVDITNRALAQIGTRSQITSMTDGSSEALYANLLYNPLRDFMLREGDYDFSIITAVLTASGTPGYPWLFSYSYPTIAVRTRSIVPLIYDPLDPKPVEYNVVGSSGTRFLFTKEQISSGV